MLSLLACLLTNTEPETELAAALRKLSSEAIAYRRLFTDNKVTAGELTKWFEKAGVAATYSKGRIVKGGLRVQGFGDDIVRVKGTERDVIVLMDWENVGGSGYDDQGALVLISLQGAQLMCDVLKVYEHDMGSVMPTQARSVHDKIVMTGLAWWIGNAPTGAVSIVSLTKSGWKIATVECEGQSWGKEEFVSIKGQLTTVRMSSRDYPLNLNSSHATALRTTEDVWNVTGDKPVLTKHRIQDTAYNALDALYPLIKRGKSSELRAYCLNDAVTKKVAALAKRAVDYASVRLMNSNHTGEEKTIGLTNLRTWFTFVRKDGRYVVASIRPMSAKYL